MIDSNVKQNEQIITSENGSVTSPISKTGKVSAKKSNDFIAWLKDEDVVDENGGKIDGKTAAKSYAKGLIEVIKTLYKKPIASIVTVAIGAILTYTAGYSAVSTVMGLSIAAGTAGIIYALYNLANPTTSNNTKQAYEVLGISTFVLGIGIYGLFF